MSSGAGEALQSVLRKNKHGAVEEDGEAYCGDESFDFGLGW